MSSISTFKKIRSLNEIIDDKNTTTEEVYTIGGLTAEYSFIYGFVATNDLARNELVEKYEKRVDKLFLLKFAGETHDRIIEVEKAEKNYREIFLFEDEDEW